MSKNINGAKNNKILTSLSTIRVNVCILAWYISVYENKLREYHALTLHFHTYCMDEYPLDNKNNVLFIFSKKNV